MIKIKEASEPLGSDNMKKVLVVDNDRFMLEFIKDLLSKEGHEVIGADSGLEAIDILKTYNPDVIFVDLIMPNIDGKKLCKIIKGMDKVKDAYLVIFSAIATEENMDFSELGANALIVKGPMDEMAKNILNIFRRADLESSKDLLGEGKNRTFPFPFGVTKELLFVKRHFEIILEKMSEGIVEVTQDGRVVYANPTALFLLSLPEYKVLGSPFLDFFPGDDREKISDLFKIEKTNPEGIMKDLNLAMKSRHVSIHVIPLREEALSYIIILKDVTEEKRAEEVLRESERRYRELSILDGLTNLYNSRHFHEELKVEIERAHRYGHPLSILLLDIDDFKKYNDSYGHLEGDKVLVELGKIIRESIRQTDTAFRYGGEEFTVILPETVGDQALNISERIRMRFESEVFSPKPNDQVTSTVSVGLTRYKDGEEMEAFIKRADKAMYTAKNRGKNCVVYLEA